MEDWIPFREGSYIIEKGYVVNGGGRAASMDDGFIEVYVEPDGRRHMRGQGYVHNVHLVELLEDEETPPDLLLDMGEGFRFHLTAPVIQAGKLFSPEVKSIMHFAPRSRLEHLPDEEFDDRRGRLQLLDGN